MNPPPSPSSPSSPTSSVLHAFRDVLAPLARLAIAQGVRYAELDELLKHALVDAAAQVHADIPIQRAVSRISTSTGINRREVTRLTQVEPVAGGSTRSPVNQLFARWVSDPAYQRDGRPMPLPRSGEGPSFESLAASVNRDVRPRSFLDELCRLGLARLNESDDTVELLKDNYVPDNDRAQMLAFVGANVGDHLSAAVHNTQTTGVKHLEQALFTDRISASSVEAIRPEVASRWQALVKQLGPAIQALMDEDEARLRPQDHRLRIGMYMYAAPNPDEQRPDASPPSDR